MQDSVLPRGVGLRKPHIFSFLLPPSFTLLTPPFPSLTSDSFLLPSFFLLLTSPSLTPFSLLLTSFFFLLSPLFKGRGCVGKW